MIDRWILTDDKTHEVFPEAFASEKEAWQMATKLARDNNRSPYEWTTHMVSVPVR